jgi:glycine betaine/proline transport system permease protein
MEWLTEHKIPLGSWIASGVDLLNEHAWWVFDFISLVLGSSIGALIGLMKACPPLLLIALFGLLAWVLHRSWQLTALVVLSFLLIANLGYWTETIETLALVVIATVVCLVIGIPLGIVAAHRPWVMTVLRPVLDLMQTIPTFVCLIPTLILFGLGVVPGLISTVIFALPAPIRLTQLGIASVPKPLLEAGEAFGATRWQRLIKVELPSAAPQIMAGLTQCIMLALSMVVIAALVGADGLGKPVVRALNQVNVARGFEAGLAIVLVAIVLDRLCNRPGERGPGERP